MRKQFVMILMSACSLGYAQVGVNTTDITSTLTVQGSISTNYRTVTNSVYYLQKDDCNVSFSSRSNQDGIFYLPNSQNGESAFGRMYNIKNLTENLVLKVKTQGGKSLKIGGLETYDTTSYFLYPGQHLTVVADKNNDWIMSDYPSYARKYMKISGNIADKTTVNLGDFSFRLKEEGTKGDLYLQVMSHANKSVYMSCSTSLTWTVSSNNRREYLNVIDTRYLSKDLWTYSHNDPGNKSNPVMNYYNILNLVSIITMKHTGEVYRVTCSTFNEISEKTVGIVVERLL